MKPAASNGTPARALISRICAAIFGGYALTSASVIFLGAILPLPKGQAILAASLLSFALYTAAIIWVFAVKDLKRIWIGLLAPSLVLATLGWWLGRMAT